MSDPGEFDGLVERVQKRADMKVYNGRDTFRPDTDAPLLRDILTAIQTLTTRLAESEARAKRAETVLAPFSAMGRVMEIRARVTFGKAPKDCEIVCESSGEAGMGILTMGHFRDAAALLPDAPGWGGMYRPPFARDNPENNHG